MPVPLSDFAEPRNRASWVQEKGLTVFSLFSPRHPATEIDIFVEMPLDFERAYQAAAKMEVASGVTATFVGFDDLLRLKQQADRPQDRLDVEKLTALRHRSTDE